MMRMKLRSPLMIQQVMEMMENSRFDGPLEFHHYWDGYVSALRDAGMITEKGEESLREFSTEINDACMYEPEEEPAVDPRALMQEIASRYPMALAPEKTADVVGSEHTAPDVVSTTDKPLADVVSITAINSPLDEMLNTAKKEIERATSIPESVILPTSAPARRTVRR